MFLIKHHFLLQIRTGMRMHYCSFAIKVINLFKRVLGLDLTFSTLIFLINRIVNVHINL